MQLQRELDFRHAVQHDYMSQWDPFTQIPFKVSIKTSASTTTIEDYSCKMTVKFCNFLEISLSSVSRSYVFNKGMKQFSDKASGS